MLALFSILLTLLPGTVIIMRGTAAPVTCSQAYTDSFATDPFTSRWTKDINEDTIGIYWDSGNTRLACDTGGTNDYNASTYTTTATTSSDQWAKFSFQAYTTSLSAGFALRRTTSGGGRYLILFDGDAGTPVWWWAYWSGAGNSAPVAIETLSSCTGWTTGDTVGVSVSGTGSSTEVKLWRNPSGADPDDWGSPCHTATTDPGTAVDSGTYAGWYCNAGGPSSQTAYIDDFTAGSCQ